MPIQITPKLERVIGIDWKHAFLGALPPGFMTASKPSISFRRSLGNDDASRGDRGKMRNSQFHELQPTLVELRKLVRPYPDNCHLLAIETNGSVFDHRVFAKNKYGRVLLFAMMILIFNILFQVDTFWPNA